ncbi:MAG: bifunctional 2-keto-4-hydroxyglutarate aldolase/2-keto-3-deoxy-6-phosphogluconate aldolase [Clostridiaceae bacterium]
MNRKEIVNKVQEYGVVSVIRAESKEKAFEIIDAVKAGGIKVFEITMTVPDAIDIIKELCESYKDEDVIIGAGTVLDSETARACILAGSQFIVSPHLDVEIIKTCNRYKVSVMPGSTTVKDCVEALEYGVDIIKIFPANLFGPSIIKSLKGPLPQGSFMPTGGVSPDNIKEWVKAGAVAVGTGGDLTRGAETGDYELVTKTAERFVKALKEAREEMEK